MMSGKPDITPYDAIIGRNVKRIRKQHGVTQEDLAGILDCSKTMISLLEDGERSWKQLWIYGFCTHFKIEPQILYIEAADKK
jgi:transcriptional regulator with XRE-family HTH domain